MKNFFLFSTAILSTLSLFLFTGCRTDLECQNDAVADAREFLIKKNPEFTPLQIAYVRYTPPVLLVNPLSEICDYGKAELNRQQVCITWQIPGTSTYYMVFGISSPRMNDWSPNRIIRKNFRHKPLAEEEAAEQARSYAVNNLQGELSTARLNKIRFEKPTVCRTDLELNYNATGLLSKAEVEKLKADARKKIQTSLVWPLAENPKQQVVFCGLGDADLKGWKIVMAGIFDTEEILNHTKNEKELQLIESASGNLPSVKK